MEDRGDRNPAAKGCTCWSPRTRSSAGIAASSARFRTVDLPHLRKQPFASLTRPGIPTVPPGRSRLPPRIVWSVYLSGSRDTLFSRLFERSNTSRSCHRPGAKMGSHPAKSRQESGGVWTVICPGKQHFANLLDSSRPARGLLHTEEVTGSIPVSPTQLSGQS